MTNVEEAKTGRGSRRARVADSGGGSWASSSQDFIRVATMLYEQSATFAQRHDGNVSVYALPGVPMLFSAIRCLLIELHAGMHTDLVPDRVCLSQLAEATNEVAFILDRYSLPTALGHDLQLLLEIRHEIIHPAHRPTGTPTNTPTYLFDLRDRGLLQTTGQAADYVWLSQLQSHRLFTWAFETVEQVATVLVTAHGVHHMTPIALLDSYGAFRRWTVP